MNKSIAIQFPRTALVAALSLLAGVAVPCADVFAANANWHHHRHHPQTAAGALALSAAAFSADIKSGSVTISVTRSGGTAGAVSVSYTTANGTAKAGTTFTATSGTLNWADGDAATKTFAVPLTASAAFTGSQEFTVALSGAAGGATLGTAAATVTVTGTTAASAGTIAIGSASVSAALTSGSVSIPVTRTGGSTGALSVTYATQNGTAIAGTDYTATSGTLSWATADTSTKTISVPVSAKGTGGKAFKVTIAAATGTTLGTVSSATISIAAATTTTPTTGLAVKVSGNHLVDASGKTLQLRGANVSGLEFVAEQGFSPANPWGSQTGTATPNWATIAGWHINAVRLPLNQSSYLETSCVLGNGSAKNPDPGANYVATVKKSVDDATAAGLYVILDLHISAPSNFCAAQQNPIADAGNSNTFWTDVASAFKSYPNVIFELFNEPYLEDYAGFSGSRTAAWTGLRDGVTMTRYVSSTSATSTFTWQTAGLQSLLNSIRATGATNVVLASGLNWSRDLYQWNTYKPNDPLQQLGAVWHAYPAGGSGTPNVEAGSFGGIDDYAVAEGILAAGVPVVITELGDTSANGATSAPFASKVAPWADAHSVSYFPWTWDTWGAAANDLIKDAAGTPTDGLGTYYKAHLACVAAGTANCP